MNPVSVKKAGRAQERRDLVAKVHDHYRTCQAVDVTPHACAGPLDVHEIIPRSAWALGIYEWDNLFLICRKAHDFVTGNTARAERMGLHALRSTVDRMGHEWALEDAAVKRQRHRGIAANLRR